MANFIKTVTGEPVQRAFLSYIDNITFARRESRDLKMRILTPRRLPMVPHPANGYNREDMDPAFKGDERRPNFGMPLQTDPMPAVIFMMGTGFNGSAGYAGLVSHADIAKEGVVMAAIDYRGAARDNTRFPDSIQDCKEAIRFLRANAEQYGIDPDRIFLMGSSSSGFTVAMCAVTGDEPEFNIGENLEYSSIPNGVVDMFGPVDFELIVPDRVAAGRKMGLFTHEAYALFRNDVVEHPELLKQASVLRRVSPEKDIPPVLILHGDKDETIPLMQSKRLYEALDKAGKSVQMYIIEGGGHEHGIWTAETRKAVIDFILDR